MSKRRLNRPTIVRMTRKSLIWESKKSSQAMDILETVSGIHSIYQISCLSPSVIDRKTWSLKRSRFLEIYSLSVIVASLAIMFFGIISEDDFIKAHDNDLGETVDFIQMLGIRVSHIACISEALVRRNELKEMYQQIKQIDRIFEHSLSVDTNNKNFRRSTLLLGLLMALVYFAVEFFSLISKLVVHKESFILFWIFYLMPSLICGIRYFQMFTIIRILSQRVNLLVNVLNQINLKVEAAETETDDVDVKDNLETLPDNKYFFALVEFATHKNSCCDWENRKLNNLLIVRDLYGHLFHLCEIFNCYFGISMLVNVGNDVFSIISNCYWIFYTFHDLYMTGNDLLLTAATFVWSLPHFFNVAVLAILCQKTIQKTNEIPLHLHRIDSDTWNDNHNTVIVGATTTYLIILIQFHMNDTKYANYHKP